MDPVLIEEDRLWDSLMQLGEIGETEDGGMMRVTGSDADRRARDQVVEWFEDAGLDVRTDPVGNIVGRREGALDRPPVMAGSHVDTVPNGGKFDGTAGVLTALEAVRAWNDAGITTDHPVEVVVFTEEEGTRFGTGLLGSLVAADLMAVEEVLEIEDEEGNTVGEVLGDIGYAGDATFDCADAAAFVELHVEQGPRLEAAGKTVGVVENITGIMHGHVTFYGEANHAGTTSMSLRRDAFMGVAELAVELERAAREQAAETAAVGTVGRVEVEPGGVNVIPGEADISLDVRDTDEAARRSLLQGIEAEMERIADERDLDFEYEQYLDVEATPMDDGVVDTLATACEGLDVEYMRMPSGAGHDAMNVAKVTPTAMLFVPSEDGISHNPDEYTAPEDLADGARVLERGLRSLATASD
jgi:hydantoinase/carbamoylase family amidase